MATSRQGYGSGGVFGEEIKMNLPFHCPSRISAYRHHAFACGIVYANGYLLAPLTFYTNVEMRRADPFSGEREFVDVYPWSGFERYEQHGIVNIQNVASASLGDSSQAIGWLSETVRQGKYVHLRHGDPKRTLAGRGAVSRAMLVIGLIEDRRGFAIIDYDRSGRLEMRGISRCELQGAIEASRTLNHPTSAGKEVQVISVVRNKTDEICLRVLGGDVKGYLFGASQESAPFQVCTGSRIYEELATAARSRDIRGVGYDTRVTKLLVERASIGTERWQRLAGGTGVIAWRELFAMFVEIHLRVLAVNAEAYVPCTEARSLAEAYRRVGEAEQACLCTLNRWLSMRSASGAGQFRDTSTAITW
jgi:hypothetical protein